MNTLMEPSLRLVPIVPKVQHYPWGDDRFIPSLLRKQQDGRPWAELWFGTHPGGESTLPDGGLLGDFLRSHVAEFLGEPLVKRYGRDIPFLLKVLAIAKPLSLQVHPSASQAQAGYAAELPVHVDLPRELWNYKDDKQKAEVLYALTPVTAMCGFLPVDRIRENLKRVVPSQLPLLFPFLTEESGEADEVLLQKFFTTLYTLEDEKRSVLLDELRQHLKAEGEDYGQWLSPEDIARRCLVDYPGDPGVLAPFFLHVLHLNSGEAIFLEPRTLHAYVKGHGIELMTNSDNVLRGGLTTKKVDVPELIKTLSFRVHQPSLCPQVRDVDNRINILAPTDDFILGVFDQGSTFVNRRNSIEFLFCTEGSARIVCEAVEHEMHGGQCVVLGYGAGPYRVTVQGTLFSASVPG
ncbi:MAG: mannose-6-phosphate isomerase, class I [Sphaerochaetaceae bacterium]|nr:mannose-6-phosphate isomerase, class I [Sphaerochaetaceae bacterium]MDD3941280.1 mannose-6-phosphate isomerase, class I [Sphaerochaetaceae bacterium]MDX9939921.1 mannose-6-phosphate isomerase, class I [Sphaerochaetaceae bacterium]